MMLLSMMRFGTNAADIEERGGLRANMMGWGQTDPSIFWLHSILSVVTWGVVIAVLVALFRWLWKKGDKIK